MQAQVQIHGSGVAAVCCARLLQKSSICLSFAETDFGRPSFPVLLSASTQNLMSDIFCDPTLFRASPVIQRRHVLWGKNAELVVLPHVAIVASEGDYLPQLWARLGSQRSEAGIDAWHILSQTSQASDEQITCGSQVATVSAVELTQRSVSTDCWMESVGSGWLFLFATGDGTATMVSVGASVQSLLGESRLVVEQIGKVGPSRDQVSCAPRILSRLAKGRSLACGSAAMAFDPVCGEGAGNAMREAILASAVVRAALIGEDTEALCRYYQARLTLGFLRHLEMCRRFYTTGGDGAFWHGAVEDLQRGIRLISESVNIADASLYRLNGFELKVTRAGSAP